MSEVAQTLRKEGIETEIVQLGPTPVRDCIGCNQCQGKGLCVFKDDIVNAWLDRAKSADGFVFGSPFYYAHPAGHFLAALDRMFYAGGEYFQHKPGAAVATARRAGTIASLDVLNKYFADAQMPVVSSTYCNMVYGPVPELVKEDLEGLQTMRNLGRNMAWLLKCIEAGKQRGMMPPQAETAYWTNFNR